MDTTERAASLASYAAETAGCTRCALAETRSRVVFGSGDPDAELMLVGEAPGFQEDQGGEPFLGQSGALLEQLLAGIGLERRDVYLATALKCRPPQNRDPSDAETAACEPHLFREIELVRPRVVASLGNFATRLLSGRAFGITKVHGQEVEMQFGTASVLLYPLYHPAAALYTPSMLRALEEDVARIPGLLGRVSRMTTPGAIPALSASPPLPVVSGSTEPATAGALQLGLF